MKMVSGEIEVETPVVVYDYATSGDNVVGDIPIGQALAALGDPNSPSELAQRLAVAVAMLWPEVADADLFLPEKERPLRGVRDARAGAQLLASLHSVWGPMAARGLMPVTPTLLPGDVGSARGSTMSTPIFSGKSLEGFLVVQRHPTAPGFTGNDLEAFAALAEGVGSILPATRARASAVPASWLEQDLSAARDLQRTFLPEPVQNNSAGIKVVTEYLPAHAVGGDFYDFVDLGGGRVFGVIGDVSGKGVTAALTMARVSADVRRFATDVSGPAEFLERLNNTRHHAHGRPPLRDRAGGPAGPAQAALGVRQRGPRACRCFVAARAWFRASPTPPARRSASWRTPSTRRKWSRWRRRTSCCSRPTASSRCCRRHGAHARPWDSASSPSW